MGLSDLRNYLETGSLPSGEVREIAGFLLLPEN